MAPNVFAVPVFFICFRECLETSIIVSILLALLKGSLENKDGAKPYKALVRQIWWGVGLGLLIVIVIGAGMIGAFYALNKDAFASTEDLWEGSFSLLATIIITIMGAALLRISKMKESWTNKINKLLHEKPNKHHPLGSRFKVWSEKYAMFLLPFVTVLREGLEAVVFIGGVGLGLPATSFPIPVLTGVAAGAFIGYLVYKGGNHASLQLLLVVSTCFLYLVAAGLFSKAVGKFEMHKWNTIVGGDIAEVGTGPGSYDIRQSVWHVNCCSAEINGGGGWGVFNALFGWTNSATYGSVLSYNFYWILIMVGFALMRYKETRGHWPFVKPKLDETSAEESLAEEPVDVEKSVVEISATEVSATEIEAK